MTKKTNAIFHERKLIKPPFTSESAKEKVQNAEDLWNGKDPEKVALAYSENSSWRNRNQFFQGRENIIKFLTKKWAKEFDYRLRKKLFAFEGNKIAVNFEYEYRDLKDQWYRAYGIEHWTFDVDGLMSFRESSINNLPIKKTI